MKFFQRRKGVVPRLRTARLDLVSITPDLLEAEEHGLARLSSVLRASVPESWPPAEWEPHVRATIALQYTNQPDTMGWHRYVLLRPHALLTDHPPPQLIGCLGGFPRPGGEVEIGYSTLPAFQRQGYATEAALAFVEWLLSRSSVAAVTAQAYISKPESVKVMQRCGMVPAGPGDDPETVRYRREK